MRYIGRALLMLLAFSRIGCSMEEKLSMERSDDPELIKSKLAKYATVELKVDRASLDENQMVVLRRLVKAAQAIDDIFWRQSYRKSLAIREELQKSNEPIDKDYLHFLEINYGPFDRQDEAKAFLGLAEKPPGAGMYPDDLTKDEFEQYVEKNPDVKEEFFKLNTLIKRRRGDLVAIPFEQEYRENLEIAAAHLREAAEITSDSLLRKYLSLRADALLSGDFYESDMAWMDLTENTLDVVIGPIESYEDQLMGLKAAYEGIVMIRDKQATNQMKKFVESMNQLEARLPVPGLYKKASVQQRAPIGVFNTVYTSGDANVAIKSIALSLPTDERVREEKGARTVQEKNIILAKFEKILVPIAGRVLSEELLPYVDGEAFFTNTLMHELAHPLGLNYVKGNEDVTVRAVLKETYFAIEETKADVVGLYSLGHFIQTGVLPPDFEQKAYVTFLASIFRAVRFGATEAHGQANMVTFNYLLNENAILYNQAAKKYGLNAKNMRNAIKKLAADLLMIEGDGDYEKAKQWLQELAVVPTEMMALINSLNDIPVDLEFTFDPVLFE